MSNLKLRTVLIDDERAALYSLQKKLEKHCPNIEVVQACNTAKEGLKAINKHKPDFIFLDIEMPWMNGFELLDCLGDEIDFDVVFVTAYDQYAVRAFKVQALDYLLKPFDLEDLTKCIEKVRKSNRKFKREMLKDLYPGMDISNANKRILLHTKHTVEIVFVKDIVSLEADSNYTEVKLKNDKKIIVSKNLNELEKLLDPDTFIRVHRSFTINVDCIIQISSETGALFAVLSDESKVPISRRKKEHLFELLAQIENR